ncbi:MAG TPA: ATP-dependent helicase, partial [Thermomicrobiales bacterium]|nr:ATP-dependent helicase [Thermomicrobiales bacterium]
MAEFRWTEAQQRAIDHGHGPLRIIAGAGSGKTATMTAHIARLIQSGAAEPDQIVALTFTNAAAGELTERIQHALGDSSIQVWSGTYHSFGGQIVADGAQILDLPAQPHLLSQVETWLIVREILRDGIEIEQRDMANLGHAINELVGLVSRCKDELVTPNDVRDYLATIPPDDDIHAAEMRDFLRVYESYVQRCHLRGAIDFGDQIGLAVQALDTDPDLRAEYCDRYRYFVVDEYQDTNFAQAELVRRLAAPDFNLRVVGDPQQSIYRFRGAAVDNIERFGKEISNVTDVTLATNFRSHQDILDVANRIVTETELSTDLQAHQDRRGPRPVIAHATEWSDEVQWIAETLAAHRHEDALEMAVLVRKRKLLPSLARALDRAGVPYQVLGGQALFEFAAVKDAIAVIRLMANPADTTSAVRVLTSPRCGLNDRSVYALRDHLRSSNYIDSLRRIVADPPPDVDPVIVRAAHAFCEDLGSLVAVAGSQPV